MKDKRLIYYCEPCTVRLEDPALQSFEDAREHGQSPCPNFPQRLECSSPRFGCIRLAGTRVARHVILFYTEATEETLALEVDRFRREAPLPPDRVKGYVDFPENGYRLINDPVIVVERVRDYARAILDFRPGERVFRSMEESVPPPPGQLAQPAPAAPGTSARDERVEVAASSR